MLRSTCPNHLILLVCSTTSRSWIASIEWRESELTLSFALTLQIQHIIALSFCRMRFIVATVMAQVSAACSITLLTHVEYTRPLDRRGRLWLVRRGSSWRNLPQAHLQRVTAASSQPPPAESMSPKLQNSGTASSVSSSTSTSFIILPSICYAVPRHRAHPNFFYLCSKHRLWVLARTASLRWF